MMETGRFFQALVLALAAAFVSARTNEHCESLLFHLISDFSTTDEFQSKYQI